jgi:hypothetical protein
MLARGSHTVEVVMVTLLILANYILTLFLVGGALTGMLDPLWAVVGMTLLLWGEYRLYRRSDRSAPGTHVHTT